MKIKLVIIPDKAKQIILTPETKEEIDILAIFNEPNAKIYKGCDYEIGKCMGGYWREYKSDESVCILISKEDL